MIDRLKKKEINAIFIIRNGENNDIDQSLEKFIRQICELFIGKYIWKQIGIIFTHYGYEKVKQDEIKEKGKEFMKNILMIADNEYENIIKNQNQNEIRCDRNEKITETLKCFYLNTDKADDQYDIQTLNEIEKIKELTKDYPSINKIQSKFVTKIELIKDLKGESKVKLIREKKTGFMAGLKRAGYYAGGILNGYMSPGFLFYSGVFKGIGLAFDKNSYINRMGDSLLNMALENSKFLTEYVGTKITGSETHYDIYDEETIYYSNGEIEKRKIHIRPQVIRNNE